MDQTKAAKFLKKDANTITSLVQCIADSYLEYVKDKSSAKAIWKKSRRTFEPRNTQNKLHFLKILLTIRFNENQESIEEFIIRFNDT